MANVEQVLERLTELYPELSPRLKQAARHVMDRPADVGIRSMRSFAAEAGVPPNTMIRLARSLDFPTYETFKEPFEEALRRSGTVFAERAEWLQELAGQSETSEIVAGIARASIGNIERAFTQIGADALESAARTICRAETIYVIGVGAMHHLCGYFHAVARMALPNVILAAPIGGAMFDDIAEIGPDDVLLTIAFSPCARASVRTARFARERGARVIALTDSRVSPIAAHASSLLLVPTQGPQFFPLQAAAITVLEVLLALVVAFGGIRTVDRIEQIETFRREEGLYWDDEQPDR